MDSDMKLERVIFSIDQPHDLHVQAKFLRHLDTARAMDQLIGPVTLCIGSYQGVLEPSFMMYRSDFNKIVKPTEYIRNQESILTVPGDTRQPCTLEYLQEDHKVGLGPMREVEEHHLPHYDGWTYILQTGKYFTCEEGW